MSAEPGADLLAHEALGLAGLTGLERLATAHDGGHTAGEQRLDLEVDGLVRLAEHLAALGVADDAVGAARVDEHAHGHLPGERTLRLPVNVLCGELKVRLVEVR